MNNLIDTINSSNFLETISFFSCEIALLVCFLFNLVLFLIFKRNTKAKRLSDFTTSALLIFNVIVCIVLYYSNLNNTQLDTTFLNNFLYIDLDVIFVKTVIYLALLVFLFGTYKIIRPTSYKATLVNAYLSLIGVFSSFAAQSNNDIATFFFLDCVVFLIYKYASSIKLKRNRFFSVEFLLINIISSVVFYAAIFILRFNDSDFQITILNCVLFMAYLLKIGIFPCVNYFTFQNHKNNLPYIMMLMAFLPFLGMVGFSKIFNSSILSGDMFFVAAILFLSLCVFNIVILAIKTKNIARFFACSGLFFTIFVIADFLMSLNSHFSLKLASLYLFALLSVFSLLCVFKINNRDKKLNLASFRSIFLKNRSYAFYFSSAILFLFSIIPSGLFKNSFIGIKSIYSYDRFGYILFVMFILSDIILVLKSFDIILNCYNYDKNIQAQKLYKKTALNYAAFWISILFLILFIL